jgi:hypothetical protein
VHEGYCHREDALLETIKLEMQTHTNTRSGVIAKYFAEKVSPEIYETAAKKEGFGVWKEEFLHVGY